MKRSILKGVAHGLIVWLVYGIVEFGLTCMILPFFRPELEFVRWQWPLIGMLFGAYALFGLLVGGAGGVLLAALGRHSMGSGHQIMAVLTLLVIFIANLIPAWPLAGSEEIALAVAILLGISLAVSLRSNIWERRTAFLTNPWVVALMLLSDPWMSRDALQGHAGLTKEGFPLVLLASIVALAAVAYRYRSGHRELLVRRAVLAAAVLGVLGMVVLASPRSPIVRSDHTASSAAAGKPNIVLITMDTVRADHLTVYGYEKATTPNLRGFARQATVFKRAIAAADYTLPTHASIFTGLYPSWHGANLGRPLAQRYVTLAETLRANGYWTVAAVANSGNLQPALGLNRGFSIYKWGNPVTISDPNRPFYLREGARRILSLAMRTNRFRAVTFRAGDINRQAFLLLEQAKPSQPFFLFLNYMDAHRPWNSPPPFNAKFPGQDSRFSASDEDSVFPAVNNFERHLDLAQKNDLLSKYDAGIAYLDSEIGRLLVRLRELGLYENTLVIITSDHGEAFGEHDLMAHSLAHVYQELVHVPLLIKYPGQHEPQQSDAVVGQVDLMPTALELAGLSPIPNVQGRTLRFARTDADYIFAEAQVTASPVRKDPRFRGIRRAIFSGSSKLITWTAGASEFYDLAVDPNETHSRSNDPRAAALADRLSKWTNTIPQSGAPFGKLDKSAVERLKSLGYVQ